MKTELSEHFSGSVNQPLPSPFAGDRGLPFGPALSWHSNGNLKRLFEFVKAGFQVKAKGRRKDARLLHGPGGEDRIDQS
jgi:hypothetical protein